MKLAVVVILSMTMLITLFWARLERWKITMARVFAGALVGWGTSLPIIEAMGNPSAERAVEIVLALLLFLDTTQVKKLRRRTTGLLVRLVLLGVSLCLVLATVVAGMMSPHERLVVCLILACIIVPTDMAPAARVLGDRRIPMSIRNLLNTESGYHDGVVAPSSSSGLSCSRPGTTTAASRRSRTWCRGRPTPSSSVSSSATRLPANMASSRRPRAPRTFLSAERLSTAATCSR
ncbi:cation:proton antiporter domain-containing protein [Dermacoccus nishinomiyaensis]|uniref:cation:proton antiporter domain-containing protein n=1 Tax=Dermacoccus nishinomiyaensis TaxID=1274 RepID=UPI0021A48B3A|nr:cation:proton antiporter [Dermacoccus nishinomiyaensis]MCT1603579.1 cation:proton antiporter [Dermacoccus nishinomiyaensis]